MLQHRATTGQPPVDDLQKFLFQQIDLLQTNASNLGIVLVGVERIAQRFGRAQDSSADETVHRQPADCKTLKPFADAIDVDEQDEHAAFLDRGVFGDATQIGRERDVGCSS